MFLLAASIENPFLIYMARKNIKNLFIKFNIVNSQKNVKHALIKDEYKQLPDIHFK